MSWDFNFILCICTILLGFTWIFHRLIIVKLNISLNANFLSRILNSPWLEYLANTFPILLSVFIFRSFIIEPFRIPSGSMLPTLQSGDFILVNKFIYGIRNPINDKQIFHTKQINRGDVIVFRYPVNPHVNYVKRVIGLPGEEIIYKTNKQLFVNNILISNDFKGMYYEKDRESFITKYLEKLENIKHEILLDKNNESKIYPIYQFPSIENCHYSHESLYCKIPKNHYFTMGDNRDNSSDSRYWGLFLMKI
ncbi:MAG: signal peptidase I [Bordetella sp.]|nr:MAG: signal peptidase I [Bordetella sp.]